MHAGRGVHFITEITLVGQVTRRYAKRGQPFVLALTQHCCSAGYVAGNERIEPERYRADRNGHKRILS